MEPWGWVTVPAGHLLAAIVLLDVIATTLHPDTEGRIAASLQRGSWRVATALGRRFSSRRRHFLAAVGPAMVVITFVAWVVLFVLGIALIAWPFLGTLRTDGGLGPLGFVDALYFAGSTITTLGFGDITPTNARLQTLSWLASAAGFGLLTVGVTYILQLIDSIDDRSRLALLVRDETGGTEQGVQLVLRHVAAGNADRLSDRYDAWATDVRQVHDKLHRYALTSLYYRSRDPVYDPEATIRVIGEAVAAGLLLTTDERYRTLRPAVEHLDLAVNRLMGVVAEQYLADDVMGQVEHPDVEDADRGWLTGISDELVHGLGDDWAGDPDDVRALRMAGRLRHFLEPLAELTQWSADDGPQPPQRPERDPTAEEGVT